MKIIRNELTPENLITCYPKTFMSDEHQKEYKKIMDDQL